MSVGSVSSLRKAPQARKSRLACYGATAAGSFVGLSSPRPLPLPPSFPLPLPPSFPLPLPPSFPLPLPRPDQNFDEVLSITCAVDPSQKYLWGTLGAQVRPLSPHLRG